jgi:hypothetical protein
VLLYGLHHHLPYCLLLLQAEAASEEGGRTSNAVGASVCVCMAAALFVEEKVQAIFCSRDGDGRTLARHVLVSKTHSML